MNHETGHTGNVCICGERGRRLSLTVVGFWGGDFFGSLLSEISLNEANVLHLDHSGLRIDLNMNGNCRMTPVHLKIFIREFIMLSLARCVPLSGPLNIYLPPSSALFDLCRVPLAFP